MIIVIIVDMGVKGIVKVLKGSGEYMTEKRFRKGKSILTDFPTGAIIDKKTGERYYDGIKPNYISSKELVKILNELHEENQKQKTIIRMLEQQSQRQINRNDRLHKDWDRLYQHLLDMGLMTDEEILKVIE